MTAISNLVSLHDGRPGVRTLLQVEARIPEQGEAEAEVPGAAATLDFIASTASLDRYHEVIEPAHGGAEHWRRPGTLSEDSICSGGKSGSADCDGLYMPVQRRLVHRNRRTPRSRTRSPPTTRTKPPTQS